MTAGEARGYARLTIAQAAPVWGMTPETLSRLCLRGVVPHAVKIGKRWFVTPEGMDIFFSTVNRKSVRKVIHV